MRLKTQKLKIAVKGQLSANAGLWPIWKGNLIVFGVLIIIVLAYFFWQARQAHTTFHNHVQEHSRMLAGVIELNARGALLSQEVVEEIMQTFLGNMARFVDYLNAVEPFSSEELTAFALEAGLAGIRIVTKNGEDTEGPPGWFKTPHLSSTIKPASLHHLAAEHLYFLSWPRQEEPGWIIVGLTAAHIEKLHEQVGLSHLLDTLSGLAGIRYVRIEKCPHCSLKVPRLHNARIESCPHCVSKESCITDAGNESRLSSATGESYIPEIILIDTPDKKVAEAHVPFRKNVLIVAMGAEHFFFRIQQLWNEFFVFSAILALLGILFSWVLYRYQTAYMNQFRDFERELAQQREDAALGRAAAAITHEIRNPLNAISMGLQRLQIEADDLDDEYQGLVATMLKAVQRTNHIVANIRKYARPLEPRKQPVQLDSIISNILHLYHQKCIEQSVDVKCEIKYEGVITGDSDMLGQVAENLIKNAIEAQPRGGWLRASVDRRDSQAVLTVENRGFELAQDEADRILEPYFTTKTRGTGLGMAIARRIIHAHGGRLEVKVPEDGVLRVAAYFPLTP